MTTQKVDDLHPQNLRTGSLSTDKEVEHPHIKEPKSPRGTHTPADACPVDDLHPKNLREGVHQHVDKDE
ncbi:hypothetical protein SARC_04784 [Sphaeroforma arctica JP610]|uniref:Uncharacterized protein n=1 Tax=Sphaeroforma arctica JP610 TaxID=667725 RepID=A0A0L0G1A7_9EUKA|nr:hypothetical protein SARC_04784 [Sphaeroforma arctica JP610]KNC82937.1 hypothetical protein SARC_04784 [Sphaeroforma arctica JP610]|eukprot:XP_014156839.1 hypothetical protein SARC_04784 [Sphaeroforma arctica JP610]